MSWPKAILALIFLMGFASAYVANSTSYSVGSVHLGSAGGIGNSTSYDMRSTLTYQQPGNMNGQSANYLLNIGWFEGPNFTIVFGPMNISMLYPVNNSFFGPNQCTFLGTPNITFSNGASSRRVDCSLFLNGVFQNNQSKNLTINGPTNLTFAGLLTAGNYSMSCAAFDTINSTTNATAWANLWGMTGCNVPALGITTTNTTKNTTFVYTGISTLGFNVNDILFLMLLGLAIFGVVNYSFAVKPGKI